MTLEFKIYIKKAVYNNIFWNISSVNPCKQDKLVWNKIKYLNKEKYCHQRTYYVCGDVHNTITPHQ